MRCAVAGLFAGAVVVAVLIWGGGGEGKGSAQAAEPPAATFVRGCDVASSVPAYPTDRRDLVAGPIRMIGGRKLARARARDQHTWPGTRLRVIKLPVAITGARSVTVAVGRRHRNVVSLGFAPDSRNPKRVSDGDRVVRFGVCPRDGRITGYPGGLIYGGRWKRCIGLEFWVEGRERPIRRNLSLGAGRRCDR